MGHIELFSPALRQPQLTTDDFSFSVVKREYLPVPEQAPDRPCVQALSSRRSRRDFGPLAATGLSQLLWWAAKTKLAGRDATGHRWESRPAPSAGGRHPVDTIVIDRHEISLRVGLYDPVAHALCQVKVADEKTLERLMRQVNDIVPIEQGILLWFVAQFDRTMAKYQDGESLVWRDAGALLAVFYLACEALDLSCCAIGITGEPEISVALGGPDKLRGVGGLVVGSRIASSNDSG